MLLILARSARWAWTEAVVRREAAPKVTTGTSRMPPSRKGPEPEMSLLRRLALPQIALAIAALTSYHVQIITRISSGYPVWYWWVASMMLGERALPANGSQKMGKLIIIWMVMYALVQGGLYASFLPPA
jgi:hypothetical protein